MPFTAYVLFRIPALKRELYLRYSGKIIDQIGVFRSTRFLFTQARCI
jgi:hypothetical protein